ncbi:MAG: hypothetical protein K8R79_02020 [Calditrichales bacterium]|nr:hypothetical protein [Calditrichales bacterium]
MGKHFGINDDFWHCLIPLFSLPLSIIFAFFAKINYQIMFIIVPIVLIVLQVANEYLQSINPDEIKRHGGYENFKKNSKQDYRNFWLGLFLGGMIAGILVGIITFYS